MLNLSQSLWKKTRKVKFALRKEFFARHFLERVEWIEKEFSFISLSFFFGLILSLGESFLIIISFLFHFGFLGWSEKKPFAVQRL
jgi:hypothetical protein